MGIKSKISIKKAFIILWLACIASFVFTLDFSNNGAIFPKFLLPMLLANILIGVITFLAAWLPKKIFKNFSESKLARYVPVIAFIYFLFYVSVLTANGQGLVASQLGITPKNEAIESTIIPINMPIYATSTPYPTSYPTYAQPVVRPTVYVDPDPIIACNVNANCGGGTKQLRRSTCENSVCCQIGNNWQFYEDKNKCKPDQDAYWANYYKNNSNYNAPTNNNVPSTNTTQPTQQPQQSVTDPNQPAVEINNLTHSSEYCKAAGFPKTSKFCPW